MSLNYIKKPYSFARNTQSKLQIAHRTINQDILYTSQIQSQPFSLKEIPFYASLKKASYTIEAAVIMPLFITLMVFGMFLFRLLEVQSGVQQSIDAASRTMAVSLGNLANDGKSDKDVDTNGNDPTIKGELSEAVLLASTIALSGVEIAEHNVPIQFVDGGVLGFNFTNTNVDGNYVDIQVEYQLTFPVGLLGNYTYDVSQRARTRKWVGFDKYENTTDSRYVFVTEKGEAYHMNYNCTYLNPSVHRLPIEELNSARNKGGAKYYQCKRCKGKVTKGFVFITDYGTACHGDINCTEIKHNIRKVLYEEVKDTMRPCSKCAGKK